MQIRDIMTTNVELINRDTPLAEAARRMRDLDVGLVPVHDGSRLVGMLTDRDITVRAVAEGRDPGATPVRDVMTAEIIYCYDDQDVSEAAQLMQEKQIRRLPILSRGTKQLVGIVSLGDLAVKGGEQKMSGSVLEVVSQPSSARR